ncbi:MAG: DNA translocase FtsK [Anaerolineae bacterium]|nr:DNA translocase FtsK [Anaerolineae bacterium]
MSQQVRPYLEYQADRVEAVLAAHRAPGRVTGGTVGPRLIRLFLNPAPATRFATIKRLADDLALAMRVPALTVDRDPNGVVLSFPNPRPKLVDLFPLLAEVDHVPAATALLGLTDGGVPLLARLSAPDVAHVLIAGTTGSGKSVLLRAIAASLVLCNSPSALRLLCIDPKGRTFQPLAAAPHLARPLIANSQEAVEALHSLLRTLQIRDRRGELPGEGTPRVIVLIDELADLLMAGGAPVAETLTRLAQRGREAGIHLVAATQHPSAAILGGVMRANFPLRLVGRVASAQDAQVASGRGSTDAHLLHGRGDFLALPGGDAPIRFQVANSREKDLRARVGELAAQRPPQRAMLALPMSRQ